MRQFDVVILSEARCAVWDDGLLPDHSVGLIPATEDCKAGEGIVLAVRRHHSYSVQDWASDDTFLWVKLVFKASSRSLLLASCYVPPAGSPQLHATDLPARMAALHLQAVEACAESCFFIAGDFNARVGLP